MTHPLSIDREYITDILAALVRIDSTNPSLNADGAGEAEIANYIAGLLQALGLTVDRHEIEAGRVNVVGILPGMDSAAGRSLMLNGHIDTVGVEGMAEPFSGAIREGRLYGRGSQDMKGSIAASIGAVKALIDAGVSLNGDLLIAAVADEEYASIGTADVVERYWVEGAIVTEPTELEICLAHKGFIWLEVETEGVAAHGSRFMDGVDANMHMGRFLAELDKLEQELRKRPSPPLLDPPSLHAAKIQGGTELSMYSARCTLQIERRVIPGETVEQVEQEIQAIIDKLSAADPKFSATVKTLLVRNAFEISPDAAIVQTVEHAAKKILGRVPKQMGHTGWMDSAFLGEAGVETVIIGPVGAGLHTKEEWVDLDSVITLASILAEAASEYCR